MWSKNPSGNALPEHPTLQKRPLQESWRIIHRATDRGRESKGACEPKKNKKLDFILHNIGLNELHCSSIKFMICKTTLT